MFSKAKELYQTARIHAGFERYLKNTSWLFGGQMFRLALGLLVSVAVARYLGPEDFGLFNYVLSVVVLVGVVGHLGLQELVKRELVETPELRDEILGTCFVLSLTAGGVLYIGMLLVVALQVDNGQMLGLFALLGCPLLLSSLSYIELWFQSQVRSELSVLASSLSLGVFAVFKVLAIVQGAGLIVFGYLFALEVVTLCLLQIYFYSKHFGSIRQWQMRWKCARTFLKQSWPLIVSGLAVTVYMKIDQVMLGVMIGEKAVGQYSVAVRISTVWYFIPTMLATSLFPAILNARKQSKELYEKRLQHYFDLNAGLAYLVAVPLSIAAPWVIQILFGEPYQSAGPILAIHAWSCLFVFLGVARSRYLIAEKLFVFSMSCTVVGSVFNLLANYFLIPIYGGVGAALSTLAAQAMAAIVACFLYRKTFTLGYKLLSSIYLRSIITKFCTIKT